VDGEWFTDFMVERGFRSNVKQPKNKTMSDNPQEADYDDSDEFNDSWKLFTKRTNEPKLSWIINECREQGIRIEQVGESYHAPITYVHPDDEDAAWKILTPIDNVPDDDEFFQ
jgi:hypothetical protein